MKPTRERAVAALRAVLELCDEATIQARPNGGGDPYMIVSVPAIRQTITDALHADHAGGDDDLG